MPRPVAYPEQALSLRLVLWWHPPLSQAQTHRRTCTAKPRHRGALESPEQALESPERPERPMLGMQALESPEQAHWVVLESPDQVCLEQKLEGRA